MVNLYILLVIPAYLIGMIPFSVIVAKKAGFDLYKTGSNNPGASNVIRVAGWKWGMLAMGLDILKGLVPTLLGSIFIVNNFPCRCWRYSWPCIPTNAKRW